MGRGGLPQSLNHKDVGARMWPGLRGHTACVVARQAVHIQRSWRRDLRLSIRGDCPDPGAAKRAKMLTGDEEGTSDSDVDYARGEADMASASMPKTSGVADYVEWLVGKLSEEQRGRLTRAFTYMDLCAGLGTTRIAHAGIRRAMLECGIHDHGQCSGLTEMSMDRRAALQRRLTRLGLTAPYAESNADLSCEYATLTYNSFMWHRTH